MPRGIWLVSGTFGCPEPAENRTVTGTGAFFFADVQLCLPGRRSGRGERAFQDDALWVIGAHSRMDTEYAVEGIDELLGQRFLSGGRLLGHDRNGDSKATASLAVAASDLHMAVPPRRLRISTMNSLRELTQSLCEPMGRLVGER